MSSATDDNQSAEPATTQARPVTPAAQGQVRRWAALVLVGCLAVLAVAVYVEPNSDGVGTHRQLGSGPCGMLVMTGLPCPTCGMTTSFAHAVRGQWLRAIYVQPTGFILALGTAALAGVCLWTLAKGRWPLTTWWLITPYRFFLGMLVLLIGGWAFKIASGLLDGSLPYG